MRDGQMANKLTKLITKWGVVPHANLGRNIVGKQLPTLLCYMLRPFAHPVACCCVLLGVVAQSLNSVKLLAKCKQTQQVPAMLESLRPFARSLTLFGT